jgi:integrase
MCDMLYGVANWLRQEELIPETAASPKRNWKVRLKQEWQALTGAAVEPKRPRHSVDEVAALFRALPSADPRLRLLVELAAELRAGQAVRAKRSDLVLEPLGGFGLGRFIVHGRGKKHGEVVDLHPELRKLVDDELTSGYLSEAEAAYQGGRIEDYFLFPAGRLKAGTALVARCIRQPLGSTAIRDMFRALEKAAGVEHQPGRSFYGLRRQATDLAPEFAQDARVLNRLTGHLDSATRERVYQDPQNEVVRARAAKARREMRNYLGGERAA